jgi:vitamin B12/bleomycin/antimicrobial peptide transport system ATP-binding/permease protein
LLVGSVAVMLLQVYARMTAQRRWRAWLNNHLLDRWLKNGRYYQLNLVGGDHQNPEYRIADDVRVATESPVEFATGLLTAVFSAVTFILVLWTIGGALTFTIAGATITIPGFLVVAAVIYAVLASGSMVVIGRRFITVSENKNQAEAEYRYVLTRLRENGESIAVLGGEEEERNAVDGSLTNVLRRWRQICFQTVRTTIVSQTSGYIAPVLPIILCAPKFLNGTMTLEQVMQAASAFTIVQAAFNWLVDNYPRLADWTASARRVASLMVSLDALERAEKGEGVNRIERTEGTAAALRLSDLSVTLDTGKAVVKDAEVDIMPGERVLVAGESGTGRARWCARFPACGPGAKAMSRSPAARRCSSCRNGPTFRSEHCDVPRPILSLRTVRTSRRLPRRSSAWGSSTSSIVLRKRRPGIRRSPGARSRDSLLPASCCIARTSSCLTRRPPRSIPTAKTN